MNFTSTDVLRLRKATRNPFEKVLVMLLCERGMQINEFRCLNRKDIDWETGVIHVSAKGGGETRG